MRFNDTFRLLAVLFAFMLGMSGIALAEDEASDEKGQAPVESAPPADQAGDEATPSEDGGEKDVAEDAEQKQE